MEDYQNILQPEINNELHANKCCHIDNVFSIMNAYWVLTKNFEHKCGMLRFYNVHILALSMFSYEYNVYIHALSIFHMNI